MFLSQGWQCADMTGDPYKKTFVVCRSSWALPSDPSTGGEGRFCGDPGTPSLAFVQTQESIPILAWGPQRVPFPLVSYRCLQALPFLSFQDLRQDQPRPRPSHLLVFPRILLALTPSVFPVHHRADLQVSFCQGSGLCSQGG